MEFQEKVYRFPLPLRYSLSEPQENLILVLHGYQDRAESMLRKLNWLDQPLPFQYLAINGPFPVPVWNAEGFKEAYSWYFRDSSRGLVIVSPETVAEQIHQLILDLGFGERPVTFLGFSQGGYLAPFVAKRVKKTRMIIGIGCGYTEEGYGSLNPLEVHAIHGTEDERISIAQAQTEFRKIQKLGFTGQFHEIPGLNHKVDRSLDPLIRSLIAGETPS